MSEHEQRRALPAARADRTTRATGGPNGARLDRVQAGLGGAQPVQRLTALAASANAGAVAQLARWKLTSQDNWEGIDPENRGTTKTAPSGTRPVGTIHEDSTDKYTEPNDSSGTYKDWRLVVRPEEQVDHFPPNAAYKGTKYESASYGERPAFPIRNREGHRPAQGEEYGYGGHVSTTNSTFVQKGYTPQLHDHLKKGDYYSALRLELADKSNVAYAQYGSKAAFNELLKPGIEQAYSNQWISESEYFKLLSQLKEYELYPNG